MHDISRHAIHVSEVLGVTIQTMEGIKRQQKAVYASLPAAALLGKTYEEQAQEYLAFQLQALQSLKLRSVSNHERLKNEITLVRKPPSLLFFSSWFFLLSMHILLLVLWL
jgi:hypothetical protein